MELNKNSHSAREKIINTEGSIVLTRPKEIQLYLEASNLNIKKDKFYEKADDKLNSLIELAKISDNDYILGLSRFLADNGLKLSPVVLLSVLSNKHFSFRNKDLSYIFNTPQRIAEAVALDSTRELIKECPEINNLIIISDEVSWIEGSDLTSEIDEISKLLKNKKVILINPITYKGTVFKDNVMCFASLTSAIVYNVALFINPNKFIQTIKNYGKD